jgi:DNA mismatch repair ATPase MutS
MLDSCKSDEFSFCIMDEIFVSTNYYEGVSGAYAIVNKVAKYPNAINIVTTHFPILSKSCMEHPDYTNYYFPIEFTENGDMMRTYKMTEGESKQHMAIKMLESKGFDIDIISDARNMYEKLIKKTKLEENQNEEEPNEEELNKEEQPEIKTNKEDKVEIETINKEEANKEEQSEIETNKEYKVEIGTINKEEESDIEIINKKKQNLKRKQKIKK